MKTKRKRQDPLSVQLRLTPEEGEQVDAILDRMRKDPKLRATRPRSRATAIRHAISRYAEATGNE